MGKATLIVVAASLLGTAMLMRSATMIAFETDRVNSAYEGEFLAREIARSAMNTAVAQARRDFDQAENIAHEDVPYQDGTFDVSSERLSTASVALEATGKYGASSYHIRTTLARVSPFDAALNVEAGSVEAAFNGISFDVDGRDTNPPSNPAGGASADYDKHGAQTRTSAGRDQMLAQFTGSQDEHVRGVDGDGDVVSGTFNVDLFALYQEAKASTDQTIADGTINGNNTFGTPASPVIVHVQDDLRINGNVTGYGVLVIDGNVDLSAGNMTWEGIVIAYREDRVTMTHTGNARVYGAVVLIGREQGSDEQEGTADLTIGGNSTIFYSSEAVRRLSLRLNTIAEAEQIVVADQWSRTGQ